MEGQGSNVPGTMADSQQLELSVHCCVFHLFQWTQAEAGGRHRPTYSGMISEALVTEQPVGHLTRTGILPAWSWQEGNAHGPH